MEVATGFLFALVSFGTNLVQLFVIVAIALEAPDVVKAPLVVDTRCQRLDAQVKGHDTVSAQGAVLVFFLSLTCFRRIFLRLFGVIIDKRAVIVSSASASCWPTSILTFLQ